MIGITGLKYDPWRHAELLEIQVIEHQLPFGWRGAYSHTKRLIFLVPDMSRREARSTLAHEVQHAVYGDIPTSFSPVGRRQEFFADRRAAARLIDPVEYALAEDLWCGCLPDIAHDLNVTMKVVQDWRAFRFSAAVIGKEALLQPLRGEP